MKTLLLLFAAVLTALADDNQEVSIFDLSGHNLKETGNIIFEALDRKENNSEYLLQSRKNPTISQALNIFNANNITTSNYNASVPTVVIAHGWMGNQYSQINPSIRHVLTTQNDIKNGSIFDLSGNSGFFEFAYGTGKTQQIDLKEPLEALDRQANNSEYLLHARKNPTITQSLNINNANDITTSNYNASVPSVVIAHGWMGNQYSEINPTISQVLNNQSDNQNGSNFDLSGNSGLFAFAYGTRKTQHIDFEEPLEALDRKANNSEDVLHSRKNPTISQSLNINNANDITTSNYNASVPTMVIAHGWMGNQYSEINPVLATQPDIQNGSVFDLSGNSRFLQANNYQYLLYTRKNPTIPQSLKINNANSIRLSNYNASLQTVVIAHGWTGNRFSQINPTIRDAYLRKSDVNVIVLDWGTIARLPYEISVAGVPAVGRGLGQFLKFLNQVTGAPFDNMHLIGFSLGAHLVGNAGRELGGRVARVTGLDPAGPLWTSNTNRFRPSDGVYTEAIHTDGSIIGLGIPTAVADVDFFVNGGHSQPGCENDLCRHNRSWQLFASTVTNNHLVGRKCANSLQLTNNMCVGSPLNMGNDELYKTGSGIYRVNTIGSYPY